MQITGVVILLAQATAVCIGMQKGLFSAKYNSRDKADRAAKAWSSLYNTVADECAALREMNNELNKLLEVQARRHEEELRQLSKAFDSIKHSKKEEGING